MKYLIISLLLLCPFLNFGQAKPIINFYNKYKNQENVKDISIQGWLIKLASQFSDSESGEQLLKKITKIRVLVMDEGNLVTPSEHKSLLNAIKSSNFEQLMQMRDKDQHIDFYLREKGETITDVAVIVQSPDNFVLLSLEGLLKFSDLKKLNLDIEGGKHFEKIPEKRSEIPRA